MSDIVALRERARLRAAALGCRVEYLPEWQAADYIAALKVELARARAERDAAQRYLRQHAISHDPTKRPMRSRCEICEAEWGGDDAEYHGDGCPFAARSA